MDIHAPARCPITLSPEHWSYETGRKVGATPTTVFRDKGLFSAIAYIFKIAAWHIQNCFGYADEADKPQWDYNLYTISIREKYLSKDSNKILTDDEATALLRRFDLDDETGLKVEKLRAANEYLSPLELGSGQVHTHTSRPTYVIERRYTGDGKEIARKLQVFRRRMDTSSDETIDSKEKGAKSKKKGVKSKEKGAKLSTLCTFTPSIAPKEEMSVRLKKGINFDVSKGLDEEMLEEAVFDIKDKSGLDAVGLRNIINYLGGREVHSFLRNRDVQLNHPAFQTNFGRLKTIAGTDKQCVGISIEMGRIDVESKEKMEKARLELEKFLSNELCFSFFAGGVSIASLIEVSPDGKVTLELYEASYVKDKLIQRLKTKGLFYGNLEMHALSEALEKKLSLRELALSSLFGNMTNGYSKHRYDLLVKGAYSSSGTLIGFSIDLSGEDEADREQLMKNSWGLDRSTYRIQVEDKDHGSGKMCKTVKVIVKAAEEADREKDRLAVARGETIPGSKRVIGTSRSTGHRYVDPAAARREARMMLAIAGNTSFAGHPADM